MSPARRFERLRISSALEDALRRFSLLSRISQAEDNSSELAGFEINKLLKEQAKLEAQYNELVDRRSRTKRIEQRAEYLALQSEIVGVSRLLKESTKKLSRLFMENKNLGEDAQKVAVEQAEAEGDLRTLDQLLEGDRLAEFDDRVFAELNSHYASEKSLAREKTLQTSLRALRATIAENQKLFAAESAEKAEKIKKLREALLRARAESTVKLEFRARELEAEEQTVLRLQRQTRDELQAEIVRLVDLQCQEEQVAAKTREVLERERTRLAGELVQWKTKNERTREGLEDEREDAQAALDADLERFSVLQNQCREETERQRETAAELEHSLAARNDQEQRTAETDAAIRTVQFYFERWHTAVGQHLRRKKGKQPGKG